MNLSKEFLVFFILLTVMLSKVIGQNCYTNPSDPEDHDFPAPIYSNPPLIPENDLLISNPSSDQLNPNFIHVVILADGYRILNEFSNSALYDINNYTQLTLGSTEGHLFQQFDNSPTNYGLFALSGEGEIENFDGAGEANNIIDFMVGNSARSLNGISPYKEYKDYFKFYKVLYNSEENGIGHPNADGSQNSTINCDDLAPNPPLNRSTFWGNEFDFCNTHRAIKADYDKIDCFIDKYFSSLAAQEKVFVIVLSNEHVSGAVANIPKRMCSLVANTSIEFEQNSILSGQYALYHDYDERVAVHEFSHIFAKLQDEYFFPFVDDNCLENFSEAQFYTAPNRYWFEDTAPQTAFPYGDLPWNHWSTAPTQDLEIGNFRHGNLNQCTGANLSSYENSVRKPIQGYETLFANQVPIRSCMMENIYGPLCAVCREAIIMQIYDIVTPIKSFTPSTLDGQEFILSSSQNFELNLTIPVRTDLGVGNNYKSMEVTWEIINDEDENVFIQVQEEPSSMNLGSGEFFYSLNTSGVVCDLFNELEAGSYKIKANIRDRAGLSDELGDNTRWVRHPEANHNWEVVWNVKYSGITGTDLFAKDVVDDLGIEPNTISGYIWESEDIWLCNDITVECEDNEAPLYLGDPTEVQVNMWIQNRGCKVFNHETDEGTVKFHWAKASTDLEWPISWNGEPFGTNPQLRGDLIEEVIIDEDIDIAGEKVRISTNWSLPDPIDYNELFGGVDFNHFCLLARIDSENDPLIEPSTLYANVKNSNNIVWKNITILSPTSTGGGISLSDDVVKGASVIVGNSRATNANFKLQFSVPHSEAGKHITEEAEVRITLSDSLWQRWMDGGQQAYEVAVYNASRRQLLLKSDSSYIANIAIDSFMHMGMYVSVNFLTRERSSKELFTLRAIQILDDSTQQILGGETYVIKPDPYRAYFTADAGEDREVIIGNAFSQSAKAIADSAI